MPGTTLPPFPDDVQTHPLLVVDYQLLKAGNQEEIKLLWKAATSLGFWYLKNHEADELVNEMFDMGAETMELPLEEKLLFEQGDGGQSAGYKKAGACATDEAGNPDAVEFINVSKDDVLAYPRIARRTYPGTVNARMESTIKPFVQKSLEINYRILHLFNEKLGLPKGTLATLHDMDELSGSEARYVKTPPLPGKRSADKIALAAHTDFGSLSFLHNRLGGLQVLPPGHETWLYVKPIPGHAICNIGDALSLFSGGILHSNIHRVVPPPGEQGYFERSSLVYFSRPGDSIVLRALVEDSALIAQSVRQKSNMNFETGYTSAAWFAKRIKNMRRDKRKGLETWQMNMGTVHTA